MVVDPWHVFTTNFGEMPSPYTAFVTLLDMVLYLILTMNVGRARGKYKISAPSVDGPDVFQRIYRTQMNTLEQLIVHLPLLWIASFAMDDVFAASFGAVWLLGRVLYARGYYRKPKSRAKGFIISMLVNIVLLIGALAGTVASF
jgi:uncharacterized membrane protein YecN with MAPEG domain